MELRVENGVRAMWRQSGMALRRRYRSISLSRLSIQMGNLGRDWPSLEYCSRGWAWPGAHCNEIVYFNLSGHMNMATVALLINH